MTIHIRPANAADAPAIARVNVDSWRSTYAGIVAEDFLATLSYERSTKKWANYLADPETASNLYVAETDHDEIIGFVSAGPERDGDPDYHGEVYAIYLLQEAQGQGTGRELIQTAMRGLRERGFTSMLLWVLKDNLPSRKFYEAVGGEYLREKPVEIGSQVLMEVAYGYKDLHALTTKEASLGVAGK